MNSDIAATKRPSSAPESDLKAEDVTTPKDSSFTYSDRGSYEADDSLRSPVTNSDHEISMDRSGEDETIDVTGTPRHTEPGEEDEGVVSGGEEGSPGSENGEKRQQTPQDPPQSHHIHDVPASPTRESF